MSQPPPAGVAAGAVIGRPETPGRPSPRWAAMALPASSSFNWLWLGSLPWRRTPLALTRAAESPQRKEEDNQVSLLRERERVLVSVAVACVNTAAPVPWRVPGRVSVISEAALNTFRLRVERQTARPPTLGAVTPRGDPETGAKCSAVKLVPKGPPVKDSHGAGRF